MFGDEDEDICPGGANKLPRLMFFEANGKCMLIRGDVNEMTSDWPDQIHVSLDGLVGRRLAMVLESGNTEPNPFAARLVKMLRFEFGLSQAGENARGRAILYDDRGDITALDFDFIMKWMVIKNLRGDVLNNSLHETQVRHTFK